MKLASILKGKVPAQLLSLPIESELERVQNYFG